MNVIKLNLLDSLDIEHAGSFDVDVLVLNAGIMESGAIVDIPLQRVRESFDINVFGHLQLVQAIVPKMIARKSGPCAASRSAARITCSPAPMLVVAAPRRSTL